MAHNARICHQRLPTFLHEIKVKLCLCLCLSHPRRDEPRAIDSDPHAISPHRPRVVLAAGSRGNLTVAGVLGISGSSLTAATPGNHHMFPYIPDLLPRLFDFSFLYTSHSQWLTTHTASQEKKSPSLHFGGTDKLLLSQVQEQDSARLMRSSLHQGELMLSSTILEVHSMVEELRQRQVERLPTHF